MRHIPLVLALLLACDPVPEGPPATHCISNCGGAAGASGAGAGGEGGEAGAAGGGGAGAAGAAGAGGAAAPIDGDPCPVAGALACPAPVAPAKVAAYTLHCVGGKWAAYDVCEMGFACNPYPKFFGLCTQKFCEGKPKGSYPCVGGIESSCKGLPVSAEQAKCFSGACTPEGDHCADGFGPLPSAGPSEIDTARAAIAYAKTGTRGIRWT